RPLAHVAVLVRADGQPVADEGERDARGRELRQRDPQEDHPPEHEVRAYERADDAHQHAADERVAQQEVGAQDLDERAHPRAATAPNTSAMCSGESSSSAVPFTAPPSSTQMTERTTCRTMRSWWLTRTTVSPRSRLSRVITSMIATVAPGSTPAVRRSKPYSMRPARTGRSPSIPRRRVVLPAPFGPRRAQNSPGSTLKVTPFKTARPS